MNAPMSAALRAALAMAMLTAAASHAGAEEISKTLPADARGEVEIVNVAGTVEVTGWDRAEVKVDGELGSSVERLDFRSDGQRTLIKVVLPRGGSSSGSSDLRIRVPQGSGLIINTVSADQMIKSVRGSQRLQSVSGGIDTDFGPGDLEVKTVSGDIRAHGEGKGQVRATTVSGDLEINKGGPELDLNTVSGDMTVALDRLDRGRIKTTNGDLNLTAALGDDVRIDAEAINGDLHFNLRGQVNAEFDIETFNGDIDNCFGPKPSRSREYGPGNELRFTEGKGDGRVRVKTLNGGVMICKR
ncbi:hypothetical protein GCM10011487_07570 [Steroidobacter agaridevorans]|uniref:DUF4097 domain-containing protein n=1 Tax=Steroidobacter agaridevorans TaxID=2695856 RepID=A0A829Y6A1_9GAMM|nr:DUF4097 family beta strand repeat-containing protein [Steroidobacter agaridevorans]GFE78757.1 hypothetical protein GCM10011487_07570 [Steroidobacter agaridevorans]GFE89310.1 hypothetical protein GCM10011488_42640 [Steroidobacter agaridevorans]